MQETVLREGEKGRNNVDLCFARGNKYVYFIAGYRCRQFDKNYFMFRLYL